MLSAESKALLLQRALYLAVDFPITKVNMPKNKKRSTYQIQPFC